MPPTQSKQMDLLIKFMENSPSLAKNYLPNTQAKAKSKTLWRNLAETFNASGPPEKIIDGWKGVWKDYKYNLKRKMRENLLHSGGTGAGPNKQKSYSDNEKAVIAILDLNESVTGNSLGRHFGGHSHPQNEQPAVSENPTQEIFIEFLEGGENMDTSNNYVNNDSQPGPANEENVPPPAKKAKKTETVCLSNMLTCRGMY